MGNCLNTLHRRENIGDEYKADPNLTIWTTFMAPPPPNNKLTYMQKVNGFLDRKSQQDAQARHVKLLDNISSQRPTDVLPPARQLITSRIRQRNPETNTFVYMTMVTRLETQAVVMGEPSRPRPDDANERPRFVFNSVRSMRAVA